MNAGRKPVDIGTLDGDLRKMAALCKARLDRSNRSIPEWLAWYDHRGRVYFSPASGTEAARIAGHCSAFVIGRFKRSIVFRAFPGALTMTRQLTTAEDIFIELQAAAERSRKTIADVARKFGLGAA